MRSIWYGVELTLCTVQFQDESRVIASEYQGGLRRYAPYELPPDNPSETDFDPFAWPLAFPLHSEVASDHDIESQFDMDGAREAEVDTPVHRQSAMRPSNVVSGPAIIEQDESTIVLGPGTTARLLPNNCIVAELDS